MIETGLIILFLYLTLISSLYVGFNRVPTFYLKDKPPITQFSIVIPFRNEAKTLPGLLNSLNRLNYPKEKFEVLLVNDDSADESIEVITSYFKHSKSRLKYRIVQNKRLTSSPKKDAVTTGVMQAIHPYIITTDADVISPRILAG